MSTNSTNCGVQLEMPSTPVNAHGFSALPAEVLTLIVNHLDSDTVGLRALRAAYKNPAVFTETARKLFKDLRFRGIGDVLKFVRSMTFVDDSRRNPPGDYCRQMELDYAVAWIKIRLPNISIVSYRWLCRFPTPFDLRWLIGQQERSLKSLEYLRFTQADLMCTDFWSRSSLTSLVCHQFHLQPKYSRDFQSFILQHRSSLLSLTIGNDPWISELSLQRLIGWPGIMVQHLTLIGLELPSSRSPKTSLSPRFVAFERLQSLKLAPCEGLAGLLFALAALFESLSPNEELVRLKSFSVCLNGPDLGVAALRKFLMSFTGLRRLSILFGRAREDRYWPLEAGFFMVNHGTSLRSLVLDQHDSLPSGRRSAPSLPPYSLGSGDDSESVFWDICHNCPELEELSIPLPDALDQKGFASGIANLKALRLLHRRTSTGFFRIPTTGGYDGAIFSAAWLRSTFASLSSHFIESGLKSSLRRVVIGRMSWDAYILHSNGEKAERLYYTEIKWQQNVSDGQIQDAKSP